jgi:predicted metalloprotease with PDZ domain
MRTPLARFAAALVLLPCLGAASPRLATVAYVLTIAAGDTTGFDVEMRIRGAGDSVTVAWARHPEYDDRFWRNVENMRAEPAERGAHVVRVPCDAPTAETPCDSARWRVRTAGGDATLRWRVRVPFERRPRGSWRPFLSSTGALVGGPHSFPYVVGLERARSRVTVNAPSGWRTATALHAGDATGELVAADVAELVESPILVGELREWRFDVRGVPHHVAYWPKPGAPAFDTATLVGDLAKLAAHAATLFGGLPYRDFRFLLQDEAYGGLEHPASVTIGAPSEELAKDPHAALDDLAHEYIHTWNMMAIRPAEYAGPTWKPVTPVPTLWFGEGLTIYYADALPRRAWLRRDGETRVQRLQDLLSGYLQNPAYARFAPESISRVAYNAGPDALGDYSASVHQVGEVLGFALDMMVREATRGRRSMDDVMRLLYRESRGVTRVATVGIGTADVERAVASVCACDAKPFFDAHVRGHARIDAARWLRVAGMEMQVASEPMKGDDGTPTADWRIWAWNAPPDQPLRLRHQTPESVWGRAGLHTGDVVTSVNGAAVHTWPEFRRAVSQLQVGDSVRVELADAAGAPGRTVRFTMTGLDRVVVRLQPRADATPAARAIGARWVAGW